MMPHPQRYGFQFAGKREHPETTRDYETLMREGFVIFERLLDESACRAIRAESSHLIAGSGRNAFEGFHTQRVYNILAKTRAFDDLIDHPRLLALLDRVFEPNYLLSQAQIINIRPGEVAQALHFDDGFYKIARPRPALGAAAIWAIDDFTAENGATEIIPRSHLWGSEVAPTRADNSLRDAGWLGRLLPWHSVAWRRRKPVDARPARIHQPILRALAAPTGKFFPRGAARDHAITATDDTKPDGLLDLSAVHGDGRLDAS